ncbi:MAG: hypothetical protein GPOALKHO_000393 [Sodalis sp.]|nr:MAG: hypothetical protein GPOALKHO_000393 [Sodalis sp.]
MRFLQYHTMRELSVASLIDFYNNKICANKQIISKMDIRHLNKMKKRFWMSYNNAFNSLHQIHE